MRFFSHGDFCKIPKIPGIYAFYVDYSKISSSSIVETLRLLRLTRSSFEVTAEHGYGIKYVLDGTPLTSFSKGSKKILAAEGDDSEILEEAISAFKSLYPSSKNTDLPFFNVIPPIYIGITHRTLRQRIYVEHVQTLDSYWQNVALIDLRTDCHRSNDQRAFFEISRNDYGFKDLLPLRAFFCNLRSTYLKVGVLTADALGLPTDESITKGRLELHLRYLEDIMHLLTYPCLGKD